MSEVTYDPTQWHSAVRAIKEIVDTTPDLKLAHMWVKFDHNANPPASGKNLGVSNIVMTTNEDGTAVSSENLEMSKVIRL